jgi:hypothetical protein
MEVSGWLANYLLVHKILLFITQFSLHAACFMLVSYLAYSSTLKMEAVYPCKMLVDFHWTTQLTSRRQKSSYHNFAEHAHYDDWKWFLAKVETAVLIEACEYLLLLPGSPFQTTGHDFSLGLWLCMKRTTEGFGKINGAV